MERSQSKELSNILKFGSEYARRSNVKVITVANFIASSFVMTKEGLLKSGGLLSKIYFEYLTPKQRIEILQAIDVELVKEKEMTELRLDKNIQEGLMGPNDPIPFSPVLDVIYEEATDLVSKHYPKFNGLLFPEVLLYSCLLHKELDVIPRILDVTSEDFAEVIKKFIDQEYEELVKTLGGTLDKMSDWLDSIPSPDDPHFADKIISTITDFEEFMKKRAEKKSDEEGELKEKIISSPFSGIDEKNEDDKAFEKFGESNAFSGTAIDPSSNTPILDSFAVDYTKLAEKNKFDPVIGRDDIVDQMIEVLTKRKKNNVILTGEAGCGKSAIIERLAQRISRDEVPKNLRGIRLCALNVNDLIAGTQYRGQFEERIQKIIKELIENKGKVMIFIDEIHNIVNAGSSGSGDMANILKPYLARGEFQCIGATTSDEYHKYIEKDAALKRRFSQIDIIEPSRAECIKILKGVNSSYEKYHKVKFTKEVIELCVDWSERYISDRHQPDKSIDVLDLAGSIVSLRSLSLCSKDNPNADLEEKLEKVIQDKIDAVTIKMNFEEGDRLQKEERALKEELDKREKAQAKETNNRKNWLEVTKSDVALAVSKLSRIPVEKIIQTDTEKVAKIKKELEKQVIGQQGAIDTFIQAIQLNALGLRNQRKPICSILEVGPSGVGKTLIAKQLAKNFFGSEKNLVKIDCGELKESHSISKLIGAPPGYVGYDNAGGTLLEQVRRHKNSLVLIDEVEKMHESILDLFLNMLDEGKIKMANGEEVDFTNTIIIFTGNIGTKELKNTIKIGFGKEGEENDEAQRTQDIVMKSVKSYFRPEFLNRLNKVIVFNPLGKKELEKIFVLELDKIKKQLNKSNISIKISPKLRDVIIEACDKTFGARDLQRKIIEYIVGPISLKMVEDTTVNKFNTDWDEEEKKVKVVVN